MHFAAQNPYQAAALDLAPMLTNLEGEALDGLSGEEPAAIVNFDLGDPVPIVGSDEADLISGTDGSDVIEGRGGHDLLFGLGGDDAIDGGAGEDTIYGGARAMAGGAGRDRFVLEPDAGGAPPGGDECSIPVPVAPRAVLAFEGAASRSR
jgi:Ca2+-binding RTX toxin-like protein